MQLLARSLVAGCRLSSATRAAGAVLASQRGFAAQPLHRGDPTAAAAIQHAEALPKKVCGHAMHLMSSATAAQTSCGRGGSFFEWRPPPPLCRQRRGLRRADSSALLSVDAQRRQPPQRACRRSNTDPRPPLLPRCCCSPLVVAQLLINGEWVDAVSGKVRT